ncbi:MAG: glucose-1-phosphate thymidylyltransferase RfbA [Deferribacterales bacterium]
MKGIILAGGSGTRLYPSTQVISKQLIPVYDKPMIYYPLSVLMLAKIKDILIITTPHDQKLFKDLLGDGSFVGLNISYETQEQPNGLAEAFIIGEDFIGKDNVTMILGDNMFYGTGLTGLVRKAIKNVEENGGSTVFGYYVKDPERYGVACFDPNGNVTAIEEKPEHPKSNYAVTGLYCYNNDVIEISKSIKPSARGELEITSVNNEYIRRGQLNIELFGRGFAWLDTGTHEALLEAAEFVQAVQKRMGLKVACIEEIAYLNKWITKDDLMRLAEPMKKNEYGQYLLNLPVTITKGH